MTNVFRVLRALSTAIGGFIEEVTHSRSVAMELLRRRKDRQASDRRRTRLLRYEVKPRRLHATLHQALPCDHTGLARSRRDTAGARRTSSSTFFVYCFHGRNAYSGCSMAVRGDTIRAGDSRHTRCLVAFMQRFTPDLHVIIQQKIKKAVYLSAKQ